MPNVIPFALILLLSLAQFLSQKLNIEKSKYRQHIISFAAAIAITYLLLSFLPEAYNKSSGFLLFIPLIVGFTIIHVLEKLFYQEFSGRFSLRRTKTFHDELHALILFVYHFAIGAVLIGLLETDLVAGILFLPPLLLFTTIGNWSLHHTYLQQVPYRRILLASSTILGAVFAKSSFTSPTIEQILINFVAGVLLFIIVREALPQKSEGKPLLFVAGIIFYTVMLFFLGQ